MSRACQVTGKIRQVGHNVSHSNIKSKRTFEVNTHWHRFLVPSTGSYVRLKVSRKGLKLIDKYGIEYVLKKIADDKKNKAK